MTSTSQKKPILGLDIGTCYSRVSCFLDNKVQHLVTIPSYISFSSNGDIVCGEEAMKQLEVSPRNVIFGLKRLIGRKYYETSNEMKFLPYTIVNRKRDGHRPFIEITFMQGLYMQYSPERIYSFLIKHLKDSAEKLTNLKFESAVVAVPANFSHFSREALITSCQFAGLNVVRLIGEPSASAIAYDYQNLKKELNVLIMDFGGGSCNLSLVSLEEGLCEVKATNGDLSLGGEEFDRILLDFCISEFNKRNPNKDITQSLKSCLILKKACEKCKVELSTSEESTINLPKLFDGCDFKITISRTDFENMIYPLLQRCFGLISRVLADSHIPREKIDDIVLTGGSSKIPSLQKLIKQLLNKEPNLSLIDQQSVAFGAAIEGAILSGEKGEQVREMLLVDSTPISSGIRVMQNSFAPVIKRNTTIPFSKHLTLQTVNDNQTEALIEIFEGESENIDTNMVKLGSAIITNIPEAPKGKMLIDVTFNFDANNILTASAILRCSDIDKDMDIDHKSIEIPISHQVDEIVENFTKGQLENMQVMVHHSNKNLPKQT